MTQYLKVYILKLKILKSTSNVKLFVESKLQEGSNTVWFSKDNNNTFYLIKLVSETGSFVNLLVSLA